MLPYYFCISELAAIDPNVPEDANTSFIARLPDKSCFGPENSFYAVNFMKEARSSSMKDLIVSSSYGL